MKNFGIIKSIKRLKRKLAWYIAIIKDNKCSTDKIYFYHRNLKRSRRINIRCNDEILKMTRFNYINKAVKRE